MRPGWDYLIVTAANEDQAKAYKEQLRIRRDLGLIHGVGEVLVVSDPDGHRIGSGGSTFLCLLEVITRELRGRPKELASPAAWERALRRLRVLIVHAGGDARRLPAYSPCGKIFIPVPGESDSALGLTLLDRQLPRYLSLPAPPEGSGQVVVTSGDVFLDFDSSRVRFGRRGITAIGCLADSKLAAAHGVLCPGRDGEVRRFLQKPSLKEQKRQAAIDRHGRSLLDIGVMSIDALAVVRLLTSCHPRISRAGKLAWSGRGAEIILRHGLDFYREVCCAMGRETARKDYIREVRRTGSPLSDTELSTLFGTFHTIPFFVETVPRCIFLHFGTMRQLMASGADLISLDRGVSNSHAPIILNSEIESGGAVIGKDAWIEGCRIHKALSLGGENIIAGVDVEQPLTLPGKACLDVLEGMDGRGKKILFVRCYDIDDLFHLSQERGGRLNGLPLSEWRHAMSAEEDEVWDKGLPEVQKSVWTGRFFPAVDSPSEVPDWLWLFNLPAATEAQRRAWRLSRRFSLAQMARLASHESFHTRRLAIRAAAMRKEPGRIFQPESGFSASDLAFFLKKAPVPERPLWLSGILKKAYRRHGPEMPLPDVESLGLSRILHTLGMALVKPSRERTGLTRSGLAQTGKKLSRKERAWLDSLGLSLAEATPAAWGNRARQAAFEHLGKAIVRSGYERIKPPKNALREDEIVWGRAPARFDLGGGWTDTPPYSLERGGCVINAAVNLNGQAPIQAYARVIPEPEIRISSIDHGVRIAIRELDDLLDYRQPAGRFGLAKAALALCGFSPREAAWPKGITLSRMLSRFGGGIELTTLAAIPSGSGLGTSSIMGAVLVSVISRMTGRVLSQRELFHAVLRLEQELTTGGGWQDQVGGVVEGVKVIRTEPGMVPDPVIHFVPADVLNPGTNGGLTLLYYTGLRRLAKNILADVVGNYLNRDRLSLETLRQIHGFPPAIAEAMSQKSVERFGRLIDAAWGFKKTLDPESTTPVIERILKSLGKHIFGATLLGAGGGGFLLLVCRSKDDAQTVRHLLAENPPNRRARFFEFEVNREGLVVTVC
ncbi:MAG: L-fucokinase [Candidatus Aminicenantales bacterium]